MRATVSGRVRTSTVALLLAALIAVGIAVIFGAIRLTSKGSDGASAGQRCTVYYSGHAARVTFIATDARKACDEFARSRSSSLDDYWTTDSIGADDSQPLVVLCDLVAPQGGEAVVSDIAGGLAGGSVCDDFISRGWRILGY